MATETSRLGLGALIVRTWRIRLARIVTKLAGGLMTVAEHLTPADLRQRITHDDGARPKPKAAGDLRRLLP